MSDSPRQLKRELGVFGATLLGLGSILGTGVFVSLGIAAGIAGPAVLIAIVLAGFVALCNALSSAQLAAAHPVAGGTYEYGYKYLHPLAGFSAGWMFMIAKSASAATAALGIAFYSLDMAEELVFSVDAYRFVYDGFLVLGGIVATLICIIAVLCGIRRASWLNVILVTIVLIVLGGVVIAGIQWNADIRGLSAVENLQPYQAGDTPWQWLADVARATALLFVAYTGYGRIATLGEEVHNPSRTIPIAILSTLGITVVLYFAVAAVCLLVNLFWGYTKFVVLDENVSDFVSEAARIYWRSQNGAIAITVAAIAAMGGVLLNLILGLSRVLLAMGRRRDVPHGLSKLNKSGTTPTASVVVVGVIIGGLVLIGDVKATWSLSAFTVLIYYGITNLAALRLPPEHRCYPRAFSWIGLAACAGLALSVDVRSMIIGSSILLAGFVWYAAARKLRRENC